MEVDGDWLELLGLFRSHRVEFVVVGAYALALHGHPRNTGDIDLLVRPTEENASRIMAALTDFGFGAVGLSVPDFCHPDQVVQLGNAPMRIGILTSITGVAWEEAWQGSEVGRLGSEQVRFLGREQYMANKRATGRLQDRVDLETMESVGDG